MEQRIFLNLGQGDWHTGFASVTAQLWENDQPPMQFMGSLPPRPELATQYQRWQQLYEAIYGSQSRWRRAAPGFESEFEFDSTTLTHVSQAEFEALCTTLQTDLNQWLGASTFAPLERRLRTHLSTQSALRVMLTAGARSVLQFPWRLWHLFEDYPQAELSLSLPDYIRALKQTQPNPTGQVRILAVLGNDTGIDVETDRQILGQLPLAQVTLLAQPSLGELQHQLWESSWDILFFAGHSTSRGRGHLQVNATESLTIDQLKYALGRAIKNGLQLGILNSCDGLGLAWALADLHLPQTIVMREPVPDAIAHQFLKAFLARFSQGESLYSSVRQGREKLHGLTELDRCAAWLPVIVQNPAEKPPTWPQLAGQVAGQVAAPSPVEIGVNSRVLPQPLPNLAQIRRRVGLGTLAVTAAVLGLRWAGGLQPAELWAYDALMRLRPAEAADPRLVVVAVDESDIQSQASSQRRGSLAEETLLQTLTTLAAYEPRMIGLDLYRDFPARDPALVDALSRPEMIGLCKSRDMIAGSVGVSPPPELAPGQTGFSDFVEDSDGTVRRQLLTLTPDPVSPCTSPYGFAALIAIHYLNQARFPAAFTAQGDLQIGEVIFPRLEKRTGGLQRMDNGSNQLLLNYRALAVPDQIAATVSLQQLLEGQVNPERIRDRIVLIGVTAPSSGDYWSTPYGTSSQTRTPGVFMQAQMISQLISAVEDGRPLIWVWPPWAEVLCIAVGAIVGSLLAWRWQSSRLALAVLLAGGALSVGAWSALLAGGWLPLVPTLLALGTSAVLTERLPAKKTA